jgi:hypothetical protein
MHILELTYPGTALDVEHRNQTRNIEILLHSIESSFTEATMALNLFEIEQLKPFPYGAEGSNEADNKRRQELTDSMISEHGIDKSDRRRLFEIFEQVELNLKREKAERGDLPRTYVFCLPFLYARSFLFALDGIRKFLDALNQEPNVPKEVNIIKSAFMLAFPALRGVRDTTAHLENRNIGLDKSRKPLDLKPIANSFINAPSGGVLMLENLVGNKFASTMADGNYGEVEVSIESLRIVQNCLQKLIYTFKWTGMKRVYPYE